MKKFFNGFFTLAVVGSLMILSSCGSDDDALAKKITIDGEKITLANGYIQGFGADMDDNGDLVSIYGVALSSDGLTLVDGFPEGDGSIIFMQLISPSSLELVDGTYEINMSESFLKETAFSFVIKNYDATDDSADNFYYATSGTIKISKSGSTYKIKFNLIMDDDNTEVVEEVEINGSWEGKLTETIIFT